MPSARQNEVKRGLFSRLPSSTPGYTLPGMNQEENKPRDKAGIRTLMRGRRTRLPPERRLALSRSAARHLLDSNAWIEARTVALYMATRGEVDASFLLEQAWAQGKTVLLPRCLTPESGIMNFFACAGPETLAPGAFGILEPCLAPGAQGVIPDLIVVPGLAFDRSGTRLGQGGGFYDRYLARPDAGEALRIGLAYSFQLLEALPRSRWDLPVDGVCTDSGLIWTAMERTVLERTGQARTALGKDSSGQGQP